VSAEPINPLRTALTTSQATTIARGGDLTGAAHILTELDTAGRADIAALDLLARVHAQLGDLHAADAAWARVQAAVPDHSGAAAGRATIAAIGGRRWRTRPVLRPGRVGAVATVALAGVVIAIVTFVPKMPAQALSPDPAVVRAQQESRRADTLAEQLAARTSADQAAATRLAGALTTIASQLAGPGIVVRRTPGSVEVLFTEGLFSTGDRFTATAGQRLRQLGTRLSGVDGTITVIGQSVALPGGPATGGSSTAMARALAAARELTAASGLPLTAFTLASGDQSEPPFADPVRDRTVIVRVTPA
jgi:hypothetical protein